MLVEVREIVVGERYRVDLGDIPALAQSIAQVGLLQPVVIRPDMTLVAGARRLEACKLLGWTEVPVYVAHNLEEEYAFIRAQQDENTCRLPFTPSEAVAIGRALEPEERKAAKERMLAGEPSENFSEGGTDAARALSRVAEVVGMSRPTYSKAVEIVEAAEADPEAYGDLAVRMNKDRKVDPVYRELRRRQARETPPLPTDKYRIVYADPPWYYDQSVVGYGHADAHYPTMQTEDICALGEQIRGIVTDDAVLFLWSTAPKLADALLVADSWGFRYSGAMFVWDKVRHNYGHYNSVRHELLLICVRGSCTPDVPTLFDSVQTIERSEEHSQKPDEFRTIIDTLYTDGRRIDLFARSRAPGWDVWGNEVE